MSLIHPDQHKAHLTVATHLANYHLLLMFREQLGRLRPVYSVRQQFPHESNVGFCYPVQSRSDRYIDLTQSALDYRHSIKRKMDHLQATCPFYQFQSSLLHIDRNQLPRQYFYLIVSILHVQPIAINKLYRLSFYSSLSYPLSNKLTIDILCCTHTFNIASTSLCWVGKNHKKCKMPGKKYNSTCSDTIQLKLNVRLRIALFDPRSF